MRTPPLKMFLAACALVLILSGAFAFYCWYNWQKATENLSSMTEDAGDVGSELSEARKLVSLQKQQIKVLRRAQRIEMQGVGDVSESFAVLYWDRESGDLLMDAAVLPVPPPDKEFQLWALYERTYYSAGMVRNQDPAYSFLQEMEKVKQADAFFVTLENAGGAEEANPEFVYLMARVATGP